MKKILIGSIVWVRVRSFENKAFIALTTEEESNPDKAFVQLEDGTKVEGHNLIVLVNPDNTGKTMSELLKEHSLEITNKLMRLFNIILPDLDELEILRIGIASGK